MKTCMLICVLATSFCLSAASLIDALNAAHQSPVFQTLSHHDQLLIIELLGETEAGELKVYIDSVGFHTVLAVIDRLPEAEAHVLTNYLIQELAKEEGHSATSPPAVGRRSLTDVLKAAKADPAFHHLSDADQKLVITVLTAAENHNLTSLINHIGYSSVLRILSILPVAEKHTFEQYLIQHLQAEFSALG